MTEQNNVLNLEQEIINKNSDIFIDITTILGQLFKKGLAKFSFNYNDVAITFNTTPEVQSAFAQYSPQKVQSVSEEVMDLTLKILNNQDQQMINIVQQKEGKSVQGILEKKISVIKQQILNQNIKNAYNFYRTSIGNVLEQFAAQRVVKPANSDCPALETILVKIAIKDNMDNANKSTFNFELYEDQLDDIIKTLQQIKQDFQSTRSQ